MIISAPTPHPIVWKISKVENTQPLGLQRITLYQTFFDQNKDYIERDSSGKIIGMWADWFQGELSPQEPSDDDLFKPVCTISASSPVLKIGGSYKLLTASVKDNSGNDITEKYSSEAFTWKASIGDEYVTDLFTWLPQKEFNKIKIKAPNDRKYLNKTLTVTCTVTDKIVGTLQLNLSI